MQIPQGPSAGPLRQTLRNEMFGMTEGDFDARLGDHLAYQYVYILTRRSEPASYAMLCRH